MDFIESIFSIVPLLMIVLFFVRLAAVSKKKNRPKPLNTIPSDKPPENSPEPLQKKPLKHHQKHPPVKDPEKKKKAPVFYSRIESLLHMEMPIAEQFVKAEKVKTKTAPLPENLKIPTQKMDQSTSPAFNSLAKRQDSRYTQKSSSQENISRQKLIRMPELKKAVIWSEILGKPKGLD